MSKRDLNICITPCNNISYVVRVDYDGIVASDQPSSFGEYSLVLYNHTTFKVFKIKILKCILTLTLKEEREREI